MDIRYVLIIWRCDSLLDTKLYDNQFAKKIQKNI